MCQLRRIKANQHLWRAVCEGSATSSGPIKFPTMTCIRRLGAQVWILKSRNAGLDGWDMSYECRRRGYPRLPLGGHLQAKEKGEDPKPPGGRQWKLNLVRWVSHGERHRQLRKTRPGGKETLLWPYAPLGAIRTNISLAGLLIGCDEKMQIMQNLQGRLCNK